jgi:hypothetical protein
MLLVCVAGLEVEETMDMTMIMTMVMRRLLSDASPATQVEKS